MGVINGWQHWLGAPLGVCEAHLHPSYQPCVAAAIENSVHFWIAPNSNLLIPSRVSGRGYGIGPVSASVCVSVCQHSHG